MFKEFKEFALKGNVVDMAVGIIIGAAFGKIVTSLVNDIILPPLGLLTGQVDFSNLFINLSNTTYSTLAEAKAAGVPTLNYGLFLGSVFDFIIVAFSIFMVVKQMNRFRRPEAPQAPTTGECPYCCSAVPLKASRCPSCTSDLKPVQAAHAR